MIHILSEMLRTLKDIKKLLQNNVETACKDVLEDKKVDTQSIKTDKCEDVRAIPSEVIDLQNINKLLKDRVAVLEAEVEVDSRTIIQQKDRILHLANRCDQVDGDQTLKNMNTSLKGELDFLSTVIKHKDKYISALIDQKLKVQEHLSDLKNEYAALEYTFKFKQLKVVEELEQKKEELVKELATLNENIRELSSISRSQEMRLNTLQHNYKQLEENRTYWKSEFYRVTNTHFTI